jgi:hypothetical protein
MNDQELLMKQITEETYQDDDTSASPPINLVNYFEKKLNEVDFISLKNYLAHEEILYCPLTFNHLTRCYRIVLGNTEIDFPSNWSIFNKFQTESLVHVKATDDEDFLCEVFLSQTGEVNILVLANDNEESRLIFLSSIKSEQQLNWIESYFAKKEEEKNEIGFEKKKAS